MSQNSVNFSGDPTGDELLDDLLTPQQENFLTSHSGTSRPAYAQAGTEWLDTTSTPWVVKRFDGTDDIVIGYMNATTNTFTPAGLVLDKVDATTAPTINDDNADGYSVGSKWVDVTNDRGYLCVDASTGAAVWKEITGSLTGPGSSVDNELTLFSGTSGRIVKRATGTGYVKVASGVMQTPAATIPLTDLANQAAQSVLLNATGSSAPPTAVAIAASKLVGRGSGNVGEIALGNKLSMSGSTLNVDTTSNDRQVFTSSGTWTKPAGYDASAMVLLEAWGAGGGGARSTQGGGGGGSYKYRFVPLSSLGSTESITVGSGGAGGTNPTNIGSDGGSSSIGSLLTAWGGSGAKNTGGQGGGYASTADNNNGRSNDSPEGIGGGASTGQFPGAGFYIGGGGGGSLNGGGSTRNGAGSVYGGGGGGCVDANLASGGGGVSQYAGNGGAAGNPSGNPGSAPSGGGGGSWTGTAGAGARGEVRITIFG